MKINFDKEKVQKPISGLVTNTVDLSKKTASKVKSNAESIVEKAKNDSTERKLKKLNPISLLWLMHLLLVLLLELIK
jgi:hypothetical protein